MSEMINLKRDFANVTDATSMLLDELQFRSRRLRDFICGLQGVAGARHEFNCTHQTLARRLDHNGRNEAATLFVTRYLAALEKEQRRVGRLLFRIERGGGFDRKPTRYVDYITPAAVWMTRQARQSELWKESHIRALAEFVSAAIEMLPSAEEEEIENMQIDRYSTAPDVQLARNETHAFSRARANLNIKREKGENVIGYAEDLIERFAAEIRERARLIQQDLDGMGIIFDTHREENLQAALDYANLDNVPVFPVRPDKAPYTANGFKDASLDPVIIRQWWRKWPDANIAIPTGEASGLLALDIDPRHGGDVSLTLMIEQYGALPSTMEACTGGGGHHLIFSYPKGSNIRNSAGRLGEGIDVRAEGGYIVVAPSLHASGRRYEWLNNLKPSQPPEWLIKLLTKEKQHTTEIACAHAKSGAVVGAPIPEGERNETLFRIGCAMRGQGHDRAGIEAYLLEVNVRRCSPSLPIEEIQKIAKSTASYEPNRASVGA